MENIRDVFIAQAKAYPNIRAVGCNQKGWISAGELNKHSDQLALWLVKSGVQSGDRVGIVLPPSAEAVIAILAIWKLAATYVPIDSAAPLDYITYIIKDSKVKLIIVDESYDATFISVGTCLINQAIQSISDPVDLIYGPINKKTSSWIIYTSGSTGRPKGVIGCHGALFNRCSWMWESNPFQRDEICMQNTGLMIIDSTWELWGALAKGVPVVVPLPEDFLDFNRLLSTINQHKVSRICLVPSLLRTWLDVTDSLGERVPSLRHWVCSGEPLSIDLMKEFYKNVPNSVLFNQYGLTESCSDITFFDTSKISISSMNDRKFVPIGRAINGVEIFLLDELFQQVREGEKGQICVSGDALALGYVGNLELEKQCFVDVIINQKRKRIYCTGDIGRICDDGNIEYLGRLDRQLKVRGFRVSPEMVESVINNHPKVQISAIIPYQNKIGNSLLIAYVVSKPKEKITTRNLRRDISKQLPEYMRPSKFIVLDKMPMTVSGKINYKKLPKLLIESNGFESDDTIEKQVFNIWQKILPLKKLEEKDLTENFFELGGDSLMVMYLSAALQKKFNVLFDLSNFLKNPTIKNAYTIINNSLTSKNDNLQMDDSKTKFKSLSKMQKTICLHQEWSGNASLYNISTAFNIIGYLNIEILTYSFNEIISSHESLRTVIVEVGGEKKCQPLKEPILFPLTVHLLEKEEVLSEVLMKEQARPFDLSSGPNIRALVIQINDKHCVLVISVHHIFCDGISLSILLKDFSKIYNTALRGHFLRLKRHSYCLGSIIGKEDSLSTNGSLSKISLPYDYSRPVRMTGKGENIDFCIGSSVKRLIAKKAREIQQTPFLILYLAFAMALCLSGNHMRIPVAVPIANRNFKNGDKIINCLMRTITLDADFSSNNTINKVLVLLRDALWQEQLAVQNNDFKSDLKILPNVMFAYDKDHARELIFEGLQITPFRIPGTTSKFDLTLLISEGVEKFYGRIEYSTELYKRSSAEDYKKLFLLILNQLIEVDFQCGVANFLKNAIQKKN